MSKITRYPICWPNNVPRTAPGKRNYPAFNERTVTAATGLVLAEINRLNKRHWSYDDENVIISTNMRLNQEGLPAGNQSEPSDTGVAVFFTLRFFRNGREFTRPCVLTCDRWNKVGYNLTAIAKDIEAQRARERWGCTSVEQAFQGYLAIPEKCSGKSWWEVLGIPSNANAHQVKDEYQSLAKKYHPDKGGVHEEWVEVQEAYDQAMAQFRS